MPSHNEIFAPLLQALIAGKGPHDFYSIFSQSFCAAVPVDELNIVLRTPEVPLLRIFTSKRNGDQFQSDPENFQIIRDTGLFKKSIFEAEPLIKNEHENLPLNDLFSRTTYRVWAFLPLTSNDSVVGTLNFARETGNFTEKEIQTTNQLADFLSLAISFYKNQSERNAAIERTQSYESKESSIQDRLTRMESLLDAGRILMQQIHVTLESVKALAGQIPELIDQRLLSSLYRSCLSLRTFHKVPDSQDQTTWTDFNVLFKELTNNQSRQTPAISHSHELPQDIFLAIHYGGVFQSLTILVNRLAELGALSISAMYQNNKAYLLLTTAPDTLPKYLLTQNETDFDGLDPILQIELMKLLLLNADVKFKKENERLDFAITFDTVKAQAPAITEEKKSGSSVRILIVDDDDALRELLADILESRDYHVDVSSDGIHALELIKKEKFSLLISDLEMPKINGLELAKRTKNLNPKLPVAIITGWGTELGNESPHVDYILSKPFNLSEVLNMVENCLSIQS